MCAHLGPVWVVEKALREEPQGRVAGGPCEYTDVVGKCTFNAIEDAAVEDFPCEGGSKKVTFQFAPNHPSAKLEGQDSTQGRLTAGGGQNPSAAAR